MAICKSCQQLLPEASQFCPRCGAGVPANCPSCHGTVPDGAVFCPECGAHVNTSAKVTTGVNSELPLSDMKRVGVFARATVVRRLAAGIIDVGITLAMIIPLQRYGLVAKSFRFALIPYLLPCAYLLLRDGLGGRSVGKALTGLRTLNLRTLKPTDIGDSIIRNWFLAVIIVPPRLFGFVNLGMVAFAALALIICLQIVIGARRRLGDGFANTQVINVQDPE